MLINFSWQALLTFWSPISSPSFSVSLSLNSQSLKHLLITIISLSHSNHLHFFCSSCPAHPQSIPHSHLVFLTILRLSARPPTSFSPSVACALIFIRAQGGPMLRYFSFLFPTWHLCVHCLCRCFSFWSRHCLAVFETQKIAPFHHCSFSFLSQQNYNKNNSWHNLWRDDRSLGMVSASQAVRSVHINPSHSHLLLLLPMHLCTIIIHPLFSPSPALLQRLSFTSYFQFTCSLYISPAVRKHLPSLLS